MKEFDYIIIGGGCAGLSLAYELEIHNKLENKTLAIIEPRDEYKRDKTWSFWRVSEHNFDDCVIKNWKNFSVNAPNKTNFLECENYPYQSIDSGLFYEKINNSLKKNKNIFFLKELKDINTKNSFIFNSVPSIKKDFRNLWQHFCGVEIETENNYFDENIFNLMDFDCDQRESVHFFYTLPFSKKKALIESTWLSKMNDDSQKDYDQQIKEYIEKKLNLKNYKITYKEIGAIPLFYPSFQNEKNKINIGTAGGMTRLSTGYTFLNIQEHSRLLEKILKIFIILKNLKSVKSINFWMKYFYVFLKNIQKKCRKFFLKCFKVHLKQLSNFFPIRVIFLRI